MRIHISTPLPRTLKSYVLSLAVLAWLAGSQAPAQEAFDFIDLVGNATGHLILAAPITVSQSPSAGSWFDPDGPLGPLPAFDISVNTIPSFPVWLGSGFLIPPFPNIPQSLEGQAFGPPFTPAWVNFTPSFSPFQDYNVVGITSGFTGTGRWAPAPDTSATSCLLTMSLAALVVAAWRHRPVAR